MARPPIAPDLVCEALALCDAGYTPQQAEERLRAAGKKISWRTIHRARAERKPAVAPAPRPAAGGRFFLQQADDEDEPVGAINPEGTPLEVMRSLLASITDTIARLPPDSPRLNPARAEARALTKAIAALEKEQAAKETPEEAERRRRREDAETRIEIERYVAQAEAEAARARDGAPHGVCVTCGAPRAAPEASATL